VVDSLIFFDFQYASTFILASGEMTLHIWTCEYIFGHRLIYTDRCLVERRRLTSDNVQTFSSGGHVRTGWDSSHNRLFVEQIELGSRDEVVPRQCPDNSCPSDIDGCSVHVVSSTICTLDRVQDLDAVASTICTSAWCDGTPRGLGCVTWFARPGTSPHGRRLVVERRA
jgi:hypothetical protein